MLFQQQALFDLLFSKVDSKEVMLLGTLQKTPYYIFTALIHLEIHLFSETGRGSKGHSKQTNLDKHLKTIR